MVDVPKHISDWMRMETSLKKIIEFTKKLIDATEKKKIEFEYQRVLHNFIQRFHLNFITISNSWQEYLNNSKFKYPFYLLLRSLISDFIIMMYLVDGLKVDRKKKKIDESGFRNRYVEISNSYFGKMERELRTMVAEKRISPKTMQKFLSEQKKFYPEQFDPGQKTVVKRMDDLPVGTLIKRLKATKMKKFTSIYYSYLYFSQYEHFTVKTEDISKNDRDVEFESLTFAIDFLLVGLLMNIATMGFSKEYIDELDKILEDFKSKFSKKKN